MRKKISVHRIGVVVKTYGVRSIAGKQTSMAASARP
jgi:hypothetical protein